MPLSQQYEPIYRAPVMLLSVQILYVEMLSCHTYNLDD